MVLSQLEAARLSKSAASLPLLAVTASGTLSIYGLDRWYERVRGTANARHQQPIPLEMLLFTIAGLTALWALPHLHHFLWLVVLGLLGVFYLIITGLKRVFGLKELVGAAIFTVLVWGTFPPVPIAISAFGFLAFSNFCWSSYQDQARDRRQGHQTLAVRFPRQIILAARATAALAFILFLVSDQPFHLFSACALLHLIWPSATRFGIDAAFLPLLFGMLL